MCLWVWFKWAVTFKWKGNIKEVRPISIRGPLHGGGNIHWKLATVWASCLRTRYHTQNTSLKTQERGLKGLVVVVQSLSRAWLLRPCQAPLSMGFSRQEYRNGLPFPSPGDLQSPGIKPGSPALQADSLLTELYKVCLSYMKCGEKFFLLLRLKEGKTVEGIGRDCK